MLCNILFCNHAYIKLYIYKCIVDIIVYKTLIIYTQIYHYIINKLQHNLIACSLLLKIDDNYHLRFKIYIAFYKYVHYVLRCNIMHGYALIAQDLIACIAHNICKLDDDIIYKINGALEGKSPQGFSSA